MLYSEKFQFVIRLFFSSKLQVFNFSLTVNVTQVVGVDNTFRRKFDREEYLQRAREREENVCAIHNYNNLL